MLNNSTIKKHLKCNFCKSYNIYIEYITFWSQSSYALCKIICMNCEEKVPQYKYVNTQYIDTGEIDVVD